MVFEERFKVGLSDIAVSNLLSDKNILKFFETAACHHSDEAGYGVMDIPTTHLAWMIIYWKVKVLKRPCYGDVVTVYTWARPNSKAFSIRDFVMKDASGEVLVIASSKWALIDTEKGLARITPEIMEKYEVEDKSAFEDSTLEKLYEACENEPVMQYKVLRRDIDLNVHVHNLYYLDFAREVLPTELAFADFNNINIVYKNGAKLGETIDIYYKKEEDAHLITIKNHQSGVLNAIIKLS